MTKAVLFDLDGTLVRSDLFSIPAYRIARAEYGIGAMSEMEEKQEIGGTAEENWQRAMPERPFADYQAYSARIRDLIFERFWEEIKAYDGMAEALGELQARGYRTILCSNGSPDYCVKILEQAGLRAQMDELAERLAGADKVGLVRSVLEQQAPVRAVMVGDRRHDAQAARGNGIPFIGCRYGLFPEEIDAAQPDAVLTHASQLVQAVERLLSDNDGQVFYNMTKKT